MPCTGCLQNQILRDPPSVHARTWAGGEAEGSEFKNSIGYIGRGKCRLRERLCLKKQTNKKLNKQKKKQKKQCPPQNKNGDENKS